MRPQALVILFVAFGLAILLRLAEASDPLEQWSSGPSGLPPNVAGMAYGNGRFVAAGFTNADAGWLVSSSDGQHWSAASCDDAVCAPPALLGVRFENGQFI